MGAARMWAVARTPPSSVANTSGYGQLAFGGLTIFDQWRVSRVTERFASEFTIFSFGVQRVQRTVDSPSAEASHVDGLRIRNDPQ